MSNVDLFSWVRNDQSKDIEGLQPGVDVNVAQRGLTALLLAVQEKKEKCIAVSFLNSWNKSWR